MLWKFFDIFCILLTLLSNDMEISVILENIWKSFNIFNSTF